MKSIIFWSEQKCVIKHMFYLTKLVHCDQHLNFYFTIWTGLSISPTQVYSGGSRIFQKRGRQPQGGASIYDLVKKRHENKRIWTQGARPWRRPLDPPTQDTKDTSPRQGSLPVNRYTRVKTYSVLSTRELPLGFFSLNVRDQLRHLRWGRRNVSDMYGGVVHGTSKWWDHFTGGSCAEASFYHPHPH